MNQQLSRLKRPRILATIGLLFVLGCADNAPDSRSSTRVNAPASTQRDGASSGASLDSEIPRSSADRQVEAGSSNDNLASEEIAIAAERFSTFFSNADSIEFSFESGKRIVLEPSDLDLSLIEKTLRGMNYYRDSYSEIHSQGPMPSTFRLIARIGNRQYIASFSGDASVVQLSGPDQKDFMLLSCSKDEAAHVVAFLNRLKDERS